VFVALGAALGALTGWQFAHRLLVSRLAGGLVVLLGLVLAGVAKPAAPYRERRLSMAGVPAGLWGALPLGVAFLLAAVGFGGAVGPLPALRRRFRLLELAGGGVLVVVGVLLASGLWDGLLAHLRAWAGSVNPPL
jgi:cytochrome c-type biogenesis protein